MSRLVRSMPSPLPPSLSSSLFLFWTFLLLFSVENVRSWGEDGHIIIANLAWRRLSLDVQRQVSTILNITNATEVEDLGSPMGVVANWADHVRHFLPWSGSMHYIDVRDDLIEGGCHYQYDSTTGDSSASSDLCEFQYYHRDCADGICVAGAILNYSTQLIERPQQHATSPSSSSSSRNLRQRTTKEENDRYHDSPATVYDSGLSSSDSDSVRQALMFLIHFIGDIHQPLHASRTSDKGGNDITVNYHLLGKDTTTTTTTTTANIGENDQNEHLIERVSSSHHYNLHSVWDTAMIKTTLERDYSYNVTSQPRSEMEGALESLLTNHTEWLEHFTKCQKGSGARHLECVIEWGQESWAYALKYAYTKNSPWDTTTIKDEENDGNAVVEVASGDEIDEAYYASRIPVVNEQLIAGGIRLAATLEDIFGHKDKDGNNDADTKSRTIQQSLSTEGIRTWSYVSRFL